MEWVAILFSKGSLDHSDPRIQPESPALQSDSSPSSHLGSQVQIPATLSVSFRTLNKLLKEKGVLIIAVPNPTSYDAAKYKEWWAAYDVPRHLWHFSPSTIQQFGAKHGFTLEETRPMPFDAFYVSMLTEKYKESKIPFLKGMWTGICAWFSAMANKERSSSMIYVFRKKGL